MLVGDRLLRRRGVGQIGKEDRTEFDDRGRVYQTLTYAVDPYTGTVGNSLADNIWHDPAGNVIKRQPAELMTQIESEYDSLGRRINETDPLGAETVFAFDEAGNRASLTDAEDNTTTWGYDAIGRIINETNALDDSRSFDYDDAGNPASRTDRNGRVIELDYDDAGRLTEERWKEGGNIVNTLQFPYAAEGCLATAGDNSSNYAYAYDLNGGMTEGNRTSRADGPRIAATPCQQVLMRSIGVLARRCSMATGPAGMIDNHFENVTDPRVKRGNNHNLIEMVFLALTATICGARGWADVERFANSKLDWFRRCVSLERRPCTRSPPLPRRRGGSSVFECETGRKGRARLRPSRGISGNGSAGASPSRTWKRKSEPQKDGIRGKRLRAGWDDSVLDAIYAGFSGE